MGDLDPCSGDYVVVEMLANIDAVVCKPVTLMSAYHKVVLDHSWEF